MWRIILTYDSDEYTIGIDDLPENFDKLGMTIQADEINNFVREFSEMLGFHSGAKIWIREKTDADGLDIEITATIQYQDETLQWKDLLDGALNFEKMSEDELYIDLNISDSIFNVKLSDRKDNEIEYNSQLSVDGGILPGFVKEFEDVLLAGVGGDTTVKAVNPFELFTKIVQKLINADYMCLKSSILGRTDLSSNGFDSSYDYPTDGYLSRVMVSNGLLVSGIEPNGTGAKSSSKTDLIVKFSELFKAFDVIWPIGMGIEYVDGIPYVVIESLDYFFKNAQYSEYLDKTQVTNFTRTLNEKFFFNELEAGFSSGANDNDNGLGDYTGTVYYTSPLERFKGKYSIISNFSASPADIELARTNPVSGRTDTEKINTDNLIFLIDTYLDGTTIKSRDNVEGWTSVSGVYGTSPLYTNLRIRPTQNIYNHGRWIKTAMREKTGKNLVYNKSENLGKPATQLSGSSILVTDKANISLSSLVTSDDAIILSPYKLEFLADMPLSLFNEIKSDPRKFLKHWNPNDNEYNYSWVRKLSTNPVDGSGTNIMVWPAYDITLLEGGQIEFMDSSKGYIEFMAS